MFEQQIAFGRTQVEQIQATLSELRDRTNAHSLFFADSAGRPVVWLSQVTESQAMALSTLATGSFAAASEMTHFVRPDTTFSSCYYEGTDCHIYALSVTDEFLLIVAYDRHVRLGPVRLFARQAAEALVPIIRRAARMSEAIGGSVRVDAEFGAALADELELVFGELEASDGRRHGHII